MPRSSHNIIHVEPQARLYSATQSVLNSKLGTLKFVSGLLIMIALPVVAEIMTDGSLGAKVELSGKHFQITPELGQQLGGNLFHSFQLFNLSSDESATFSGADSVQNIISRVTGGSPSLLDGLIRSTLPNADLYFINPYGVMFGQNTKLDLHGGFHVSTADYLKLQDGGQFDARNLNNSLLSVAPIAAFGFLTNTPAAISTQNSQLAVPGGETLSLIGGTITLTGSEPPVYNEKNGIFDLNSHSWLFAESGVLRLASLAGIGEVANENIALSAPGGDILINNTSLVTDRTEGGGSILISGGKILMTHSYLDAATVDRPGGILSIKADELILQDDSWITNNTRGSGTGGLVDIKTGQLRLLNSRFDSSTYATENGGRAGELHLQATQFNLSNSLMSSSSHGSGHGGNLYLNVGYLTLDENSEITTDSYDVNSTAMGGEIHIEAIEITSRGTISGESYNAGFAGLLGIKAQELLLENGASIRSATHFSGQGGIITLEIADALTLRGRNQQGHPSGIFASTTHDKLEKAGNAGYILIQAGQVSLEDAAAINSSTQGSGQAGDLTIVAQQLKIMGGSQLGSGTFSSGRGGNMTLMISDTLTVSGNRSDNQGISSGIFANSEHTTAENAGNAGSIYIKAGNVELLDGGNLNSATYGAGKGGMIEMHVADRLTVRGTSQQGNPSIISASTTNMELQQAGDAGQMFIQAGRVNVEDSGIINSDAFGTGRAGNLAITAQQLKLTGGAQIGSGTFGAGQGGNIHLIISGTLMVSGDGTGKDSNSGIFASSENNVLENSGNAGNIYIEAGDLQLLKGGNISSATSGTGQGGNIQLIAKSLNVSGKTAIGFSSNIYATSFSEQPNAGNAGTLTIQADDITLSDGGRISTQSNHSGGGDIEIETAHLLDLYHGNIITSVNGGIGNGGNITVQRPAFIVLNQGNIRAQADEGQGGNIYLAAQQFVYSTESVISASSNKGLDGEIWIDSPENSLHNQLVTLPAMIPLEMGLKTPCSALSGENISSFAVAMNSGIPNIPDDLQSGFTLEAFQHIAQNGFSTQTVQKVIVPTFKISCRKLTD